MLRLGLIPSSLARGCEPALAVQKAELHFGSASLAEGVSQQPHRAQN